jgi:hypothetical protein
MDEIEFLAEIADEWRGLVLIDAARAGDEKMRRAERGGCRKLVAQVLLLLMCGLHSGRWVHTGGPPPSGISATHRSAS